MSLVLGSSRPRARRLAARAIIVVAVIVFFACSRTGEPPKTIDIGGKKVPVEQLQEALSLLCTSREVAAGGDIESARRIFEDRVHSELHTLAGALEKKDRPFAGRLLETKHRVETDFERGDDSALPGHLDALIKEMALGLTRLSIPPPPCV